MKKKIRRTFEYLKTHKKARIFSIAIISVVSIFFLVNFSRYVKQIIENYITRTERFYFNSDKLTTDNKTFEINYWPGAAPYEISITVNSLDNNLRGTDIEIDYALTCEAGAGIRCELSQNGGTIETDTNKDTFTATAIPTRPFQDGESSYIKVTARTTEPFEKELSATFVFVVGHYGLSYKIEDEQGQPYLESVISNTDDYYIVRTAFGTHSVGDRISTAEYSLLSEGEKNNCTGVIIELSFDPNDLRLDMTNYYYQNKISETIEPLSDGYNYVNSFKFSIPPQTAIAIKFYKLDVTENYTYPLGEDDDPIVEIDAS